MSLILLQKEKHTRRREVTYTSSYQGQKLKRLAKPETGVCFPSHSREQNPRKLGFPLCNPSTLQELQRLCSARLCQQKLSEGCCFKFPTWRLCCWAARRASVEVRWGFTAASSRLRASQPPRTLLPLQQILLQTLCCLQACKWKQSSATWGILVKRMSSLILKSLLNYKHSAVITTN